MKKLSKKIFMIIIILVLFVIIIVMLVNKNGIGSAGINMEEYDKIDIGMSNFEVNSIIDEKEEWDNDEVYNKCVEEISKEYNDGKYTYSYKYYGEKAGYAIITYGSDYGKNLFNTPKVIKKEQFNLK